MTAKLPRTSKKGYRLEGSRAEALLFHGYTGSPYDLRPLSDVLAHAGIATSVPLLKGHGTKPADLFTTTAEDWLLDAERRFDLLDTTKPIIIGGLSMGGLLAILLAAENKDVRGLMLLSPSLKLSLSAEMTILSAQMGLLNKHTSLPKLSGGSDIADPEAKAKTPAYLEMPVAGLLEFERLRVLALERLHRIACPIFVAFGKHDAAINPIESHRVVMEHTRAPIVAKFYERSKHVITLDYDRERVGTDVLRFLTETCGILL